MSAKAEGITSDAREPRAPPRSDEFPPGIPYIVGNEGAERFSYYGMRAILYVYLAALYVQFVPDTQLAAGAADAAKARATGVAHLFMAGVYAFPMIGAILADRLLGKYPVILWVSLLYCAGHAVLAGAGHFAGSGDYVAAEYGMYLGLALIAIGSGGIKPCVSANVGDQFSAKNSHLVTRVFQIFYFIINFGSFFSTLLTPLLYARFGPEVAFGVPGIVMGLATVVFWMGRNKFTRVPPKPGGKLGLLDFVSSALLFSPVVAVIVAVFVQGESFSAGQAVGMSKSEFYVDYVGRYVAHLARTSWPYFAIALVSFAVGLALFVVRQRKHQDDGFLAVLVYALRHRARGPRNGGAFAVARQHFGDEAAEGPPAVLRIIVVFSMVSVFWALFDQHASTWIEQAKHMNRVLTVPTWTARYVLAATVGLALYGGTWLMLWVSNMHLPRWIHKAVVGAVVALGLIAGLLDMLGGQTTTFELEAAQISALNPLMVMMIIPLLNVAVYKPLEKRGITVKPLQKMTLGMFLAGAAFAIAAVLQQRVEARAGTGAELHVLWQIAQYLVMTTAEVLVSVTGLEFAYTQAPRRMKSTIMGFWLLCVTFGNILVAFLAPMQTILSLSQFFWVFTALMIAAAVLFSILAYFYKGRTYLQAEAAH
jgi:POT family proton-dependent oligopeptide transporter